MNEMEKSLLVRVLRVLGTQGTEPARPRCGLAGFWKPAGRSMSDRGGRAMRPKIADYLCDTCYAAIEHVAGGSDDWELWVMLMAAFACKKCAPKIERRRGRPCRRKNGSYRIRCRRFGKNSRVVLRHRRGGQCRAPARSLAHASAAPSVITKRSSRSGHRAFIQSIPGARRIANTSSKVETGRAGRGVKRRLMRPRHRRRRYDYQRYKGSRAGFTCQAGAGSAQKKRKLNAIEFVCQRIPYELKEAKDFVRYVQARPYAKAKNLAELWMNLSENP